MLIEEVKLRFGAGPEADPLVLEAPAVTIFVGPNNSGKSMVLREIASFCRLGTTSGIIFDELKFRKQSVEEIDKSLEGVPHNGRNLGEEIDPNQVYLNFRNQQQPILAATYRQALQNPSRGTQHTFARYYATLHVLILDGPSRIKLIEAQNRGDLKDPQSTFAKLLMDDTRREALRKILFEAFGLQLGMDIFEGDLIKLRYGDRDTPLPNERSLEDATRDWMKKALPTDQWSDGMKAFTGMLLSLRAGDPKITIIDEPEAFLHPTLAYKLGREIAKTASQGDKQVFVSTHSSQFLMGAIQSGAKVNIVRLTYQPGSGTQPASATARMLSNDDIRTMMQDPYLRSANVLSGIFYEGVVVTEADADRAFYQELNERLLEKDPKRGAANTLFLNANGKDSVRKIVGPLRKLGIPVAAILDIDALKSSSKAKTKSPLLPLLNAISYPQPHHSMKSDRADVWKSLEATNKDPKSEGGIALLTDEAKEKAENLFDLLDRYGLFVLRHGEVEHWLPDLKISRSKTGKDRWLSTIFEALGSDPEDPAYVHPEDNDVWDFLDRVGAWIKNKDRRGIPS
ncbi:ATP-dependent nuclease [Oecophyllibacter saccharovorans]|uniref:ATP-binding protein n=1 Tax=Oecophyllibacter saccharovorans TaxID=2558360 RepID=A0A506UMF0_9PROT|nr:ATP-binding protein [Oecophyllibacter saccharovorans]TPW34412.1 ATP-binding protein [Oecophyllibacter saccharovorans]